MTNTIPNVPRDFKKRPVTIQAIKWTGDNLFDVIKFMSGAPSIGTCIGAAKWKEYCDLVQDSGLIIKTLEGQHIATVGDMIIRGVKGEFYPCKPDIFDMTYELSAPSPAGVDGLNTDRNAAFKACPESGCDWGSFYLGWKARGEVEQAIIDGLRGEVGAQRIKTCTALKERNDAREERDQQAQRIGELEGLLRAESARVDFLDAYIVTADAPDTGKAAMLADSGTLRECIDAALSVGKEGE